MLKFTHTQIKFKANVFILKVRVAGGEIEYYFDNKESRNNFKKMISNLLPENLHELKTINQPITLNTFLTKNILNSIVQKMEG